LKSIERLDEKIADKSGTATYKDPPVPEGVSEYEFREIPTNNIVDMSSLRMDSYDYGNDITRHIVIFLHKDHLVRVVIAPRPGNRLLVYLFHIPIESGKIWSERRKSIIVST